MKKLIKLLTAVGVLALALVGGNAVEASTEREVITIGTSSIARDVLEVAQELFNESNEDYILEIQVFDDAVTPNIATVDGSIDGTFHQYESYMDNFNKDRNATLVTYGPEVFAFQIGLYSDKISDISEIEDGFTVAIANDPSNRALALNLLADEGLITLKEGVEVPSVLDVVENPLNLQFLEIERLGLANAIDDVELSIAMSDVIKQAGRDAGSALAYLQEEGIKLVIKEESPWNDALVEALTSEEVRTYIEEETDKTKIALFGEDAE